MEGRAGAAEGKGVDDIPEDQSCCSEQHEDEFDDDLFSGVPFDDEGIGANSDSKVEPGVTDREARVFKFAQHNDDLVEALHSLCFDRSGNFSLPAYKCWEKEADPENKDQIGQVRVFTQYGVESTYRSSDFKSYIQRGLLPSTTDVQGTSHVMERRCQWLYQW